MPAHARERRQAFPQHLFEEALHQRLPKGHHRLFIRKGQLDVHLGEFGLAIGPEVLVPEALGNLVVAIKPGNHEELLKELGRLGQGEKLSEVGAARHEVIPGALRSGPSEDRGFHVDAARLFQRISDDPADLGAKSKTRLHFRTAQIEVAIAQSDVFPRIRKFVEHKGWGRRTVQKR